MTLTPTRVTRLQLQTRSNLTFTLLAGKGNRHVPGASGLSEMVQAVWNRGKGSISCRNEESESISVMSVFKSKSGFRKYGGFGTLTTYNLSKVPGSENQLVRRGTGRHMALGQSHVHRLLSHTFHPKFQRKRRCECKKMKSLRGQWHLDYFKTIKLKE